MDPDCRLYLISPPTLSADFPTRLAEALDAGDIAAFRLELPGADPAELRQAIATLRPVVQSRGVALILAGDAPLAAATGCDGVHLDETGAILAQARRAIGELQLGAFCGLSRDLAMEAGESGADYVAFGLPNGDADAADLLDVIGWWSELMELPVVAEGEITEANCGQLAKAGANFLAVGAAIWAPGASGNAIAALSAAIANG